MSHIPASRMPHARAHDDHEDGKSVQPDQAQPAPEPTTTVPPASASGAAPTSAGDPGGVAGTTNGGAGGGERGGTTSSADADPTGGSDTRSGPVNGPGARDDADDRSPLAIAAMVVGGLAVVGGIVAALLPVLQPKDEPKSKKRKRRKNA